nr:MAG TPA: hypothetical protein [Caudoviricetes sp.]
MFIFLHHKFGFPNMKGDEIDTMAREFIPDGRNGSRH